MVQSHLWYLYQAYLKGSSDFSQSSSSMFGQLRQLFWATRSVLYELPWQMCEGKTLIPLVALMPGVQGGIPLIFRIQIYFCWSKDGERKKGLSKEESELLLLWSVPLPFLSSLTAKKASWYWPDPLTPCFYSSQHPNSALCLCLLPDFAHHYPVVITHSASFSHYIWETFTVRNRMWEGFLSLLQLQV